MPCDDASANKYWLAEAVAANRLRDAAPEMYELLEWLIEWQQVNGEAKNRVDALIRRAKGE